VHDRVDVLLTLLGGVGVVEAQMTAAAVVARQTEVDADRLGVTDVQVAVGLGRKARDDLPADPAAAVVLLDDLPNEIGPRRFAHRPDRITALSADRTVGHRGRLMIIASCSSSLPSATVDRAVTEALAGSVDTTRPVRSATVSRRDGPT